LRSLIGSLQFGRRARGHLGQARGLRTDEAAGVIVGARQPWVAQDIVSTGQCRSVALRVPIMFYAVLKALHVLSVVLWVGGMIFAHFFLRPAVAALEPPQRLRLMHDVLGRFFRAVLAASLLALATGVWMVGRVAKQVVQAGASFQMPASWWLMTVLGVLMVAIFLHIRFALYARLGRAVAAADWPAGGAALAQLRLWVSVNLVLGLLIIIVVFVGL